MTLLVAIADCRAIVRFDLATIAPPSSSHACGASQIRTRLGPSWRHAASDGRCNQHDCSEYFAYSKRKPPSQTQGEGYDIGNHHYDDTLSRALLCGSRRFSLRVSHDHVDVYTSYKELRCHLARECSDPVERRCKRPSSLSIYIETSILTGVRRTWSGTSCRSKE
jgi:hypothetical protein